MDLTSWRRVSYLYSDSSGKLDDKPKNQRRYIPFITGISASIESHLNRNIESKARTEYFDIVPGQVQFFVSSYPISTLTSMKTDSTSLFSGSETTETNIFTGPNNDSVVLDTPSTPAIKGLQVVYTGGMASHGTQSQFILSTEAGTVIAVGNYVMGGNSRAVGYVISKVSTAITIEVLYGRFIVDETITPSTTEDGDAITGASAVLASREVESLAESNPDIVLACEIELMYGERHKTDLENGGTSKGQTNRADYTQDYDLQPQVRKILEKYIHYSL